MLIKIEGRKEGRKREIREGRKEERKREVLNLPVWREPF